MILVLLGGFLFLCTDMYNKYHKHHVVSCFLLRASQITYRRCFR